MSHRCPVCSLPSPQLSIRVLLLGPAGHQRHHHLPQRSPLYAPAHSEEVSPASSLVSVVLLPRPRGSAGPWQGTLRWALWPESMKTGGHLGGGFCPSEKLGLVNQGQDPRSPAVSEMHKHKVRSPGHGRNAGARSRWRQGWKWGLTSRWVGASPVGT